MTKSPIAAPSPRHRSRVTNGKRAFVEGDGKSAWARRWKDIVALHAADLGGPDALSEAQASLCRRCATLEVELEQLEGRLSMGRSVDLDVYARVAGHLRRYLETLGVRRVSKDVTPPTLQAYLAARAAEADTSDGDDDDD